MNNRKLNRTRPIKLVLYGDPDRHIAGNNRFSAYYEYWGQHPIGYGSYMEGRGFKASLNGLYLAKGKEWVTLVKEPAYHPAWKHEGSNCFYLYADQQMTNGLYLSSLPLKWMDLSRYHNLNYLSLYNTYIKTPNAEFPARFAGLVPASFAKDSKLRLYFKGFGSAPNPIHAYGLVEKTPELYPFFSNGLFNVDVRFSTVERLEVRDMGANKITIKTANGFIDKLTYEVRDNMAAAITGVSKANWPETLDLSEIGVKLAPAPVGSFFLHVPHANIIMPPADFWENSGGSIYIRDACQFLEGKTFSEVFGTAQRVDINSSRNPLEMNELRFPQRMLDITGTPLKELSIDENIAGVIDNDPANSPLERLAVINSPLSDRIVDASKIWSLQAFKDFCLAHPKLIRVSFGNNGLNDQEMFDLLTWFKDVWKPTRPAGSYCYLSSTSGSSNIPRFSDDVNDLTKHLMNNCQISDSGLNTLLSQLKTAFGTFNVSVAIRDSFWQLTALDTNTIQADWLGERNPTLYSGTSIKPRPCGIAPNWTTNTPELPLVSCPVVSGSRTADYRQFKFTYPAHGRAVGLQWRQRLIQ